MDVPFSEDETLGLRRQAAAEDRPVQDRARAAVREDLACHDHVEDALAVLGPRNAELLRRLGR